MHIEINLLTQYNHQKRQKCMPLVHACCTFCGIVAVIAGITKGTIALK